MLNMKHTFLFATAVLLAACSHQDEADEQRPAVPLQLCSGISTTVTRAFDTTWESGNAIGVFTTEAGTSTLTRSGSQNDENIGYQTSVEADTYNQETSQYTYSAFTSVSPDKKIYMPVNGTSVDVYAYYPYTQSVTATTPLSINIPTTQTAANQKTVDVLRAVKESTTEQPINIDYPSADLLFSHVMSKVIVYVKTGTGYSDSELTGSNISSVQLTGQPTAATFAPVTPISNTPLSITAGSAAITMQEITDTSDPDYRTTYTYTPEGSQDAVTFSGIIHCYRAIILPNGTNNAATSGSERQIKFRVGSLDYTYNITQTFKPGQQTVFTITLAAEQITVTAAITDWTYNTIEPDKPLLPTQN